MQLPNDLTERAEAATRLLSQTLGLYRRQMQSMTLRTATSRLGTRSFDGQQVQRQATLLRFISIAEAFCGDRLVTRAEEDFDASANSVRSIVWDRAADEATGNWASIQSSYKKWYGATPDWAAVNALNEARNAIAHGLGRFTRRQKRRADQVIVELGKFGITVDGDRVVLEDADLVTVADACKALIAEVDKVLN